MTTNVLEDEPAVDRATAESTPPRVRTAIAMIMVRFPRIDETFILREIDELESQGQPVLIVPILRGDTTVVHEEAKPWMRRALYLPFISLAILRSNLALFVRMPRRFLALLSRLIIRTALRPSTLLRTLALFPKSVHLADTLPRRGIQHVHAHFATHATTMAYIICALSDLTYSFTVHGPDIFVHRMLLREKIRHARFVRAISVFNKAFLSGLYPVESEGKIEVVHSGVDPSIYATEEQESTGRARLLSVAAMTASRGFPFLVDACARLVKGGTDIDCTIVGTGPLRRSTEHWIATHDLAERVHLLGAQPQHEVARLMREADVFVLPSVIALDGQMDGIPVSLMEAMAAGKPVIATSISGIPELVRDNITGLVVDATNPERIAAAVRRLLSDPGLRQRLGRAGQQRVCDAFDLRKTTAALLALFDRQRGVNRPHHTVAQRVQSIDWSRLAVSAVGIKRVDERAGSFLAEVTLASGDAPREVIVRMQRESDGTPSASAHARHLFETLSSIGRSMSAAASDGFTYQVPNVLMFDEARAAIVVERADGRSLGGLVRSAVSIGIPGKLMTPMRRAGAWLAFMQRGTTASGEDGRHLLSAIAFLALQDLNLAVAADRSLRRHYESVAHCIRTLESIVACQPLAVVGHHGDFRPDSVFIGDRHVTVVDFGGHREGLPLEDLAQFALHIDTALGPAIGSHKQRLREAFLEGYATNGGLIDREALRLFTVMRALHQLAHDGSAATAGDLRRRSILRQAILRSVA